jgi:hypothetical protein
MVPSAIALRGRGAAASMLLAGVVACGLLPLPSVASPLTLQFSGGGAVVPGPGFDPNLPVWPLFVPAVPDSYVLGGQSGWSLTSAFDFDVTTGTGRGTFTLANAFGDSLFGTLATVTDVSNGPFGGFDIQYAVDGGTGAWAGFQGSGSSEVTLTSDPRQFPTTFLELGTITQRVPEPGSLLLASLGLALGGALRRRTAG